ncbi:hypothetical protein ECP03047772_3701 [Escherichia coli P0304777.2]|nr:hypothetical protein ECP03047771_3715 [Escherichia coli P0304777.1]ENE68615.1 hypothetical protein ECP030477714_3796 [Escherichia coli P0304777.14]ENE78774.1 hypothetical protein ECP03047772_3701 [Escherichia coli P0304777.2]
MVEPACPEHTQDRKNVSLFVCVSQAYPPPEYLSVRSMN